MFNILVTGGTGFIGSHLCEELIRQKHCINVLTSSGNTDNLASITGNNRLAVIKADISDYNGLKKKLAAKKFDIIFHLASYIPLGIYDDNKKCVEINDLGTKNILQIARVVGCNKFIYSSTGWVYGHPKHIPIDEDHPLNPFDAYGKTKLNGEKHCKIYSKYMNIIILRYAGVYGPRKNKGAVYNFIKNMLEKKTITIHSDGTQTNDYVYVQDIVNSNILAMKALDVIQFDIFNIGGGKEIAANQLAILIGNLLKTKSIIVYTKTPVTNKRYLLDIKKAQKKLLFQPTELKICLKEFIPYVKNIK